MDVLDGEFQEGMIFALKVIQDIPCVLNIQEEEGIE